MKQRVSLLPMAYRPPSGVRTTASSGEFAAPSLAPFYCAWDAQAALRGDGGDEQAAQEWAKEFLHSVLVHYAVWEDAPPVVDLTSSQSQGGAASASAAAGGSNMCIAPPSSPPSSPPSPPQKKSNPILTRLDQILLEKDVKKHYAVNISALTCLHLDPRLGSLLLSYPTVFLPLVDEALLQFQECMLRDPSNAVLVRKRDDGSLPPWTPKPHIHARIHELPLVEGRFHKPTLSALTSSDVYKLVSLSGTVIRTGGARMVESLRRYKCRKCDHEFTVGSDLDQGHILVPPSSCPPVAGKRKCRSSAFDAMDEGTSTRDFQRIKLQDGVMKLAQGSLPRSIQVLLQDDLVDRVCAGDEVEVVGIVRRMWAPLQREGQCHCELYIDAVHVALKHDRCWTLSSMSMSLEDYEANFRALWRQALNEKTDLHTRGHIIASFCPQLYGLFIVKLAVLLTIIGGVAHESDSGIRVRGDCHMLMIGDAGTGKSQILKFAAQLSPRSVLTTGTGTTSAGLTVAAVKDVGGEWALEPGALVLASGGVCCIDEIGCMAQHDRASMHEALEQQTVSVAKAGLVATLPARTTVIGAMNPKSGAYDDNSDLSMNTSLPSPLLSRFDLIMLLLDKQNTDWDQNVAQHILDSLEKPLEEEVQVLSKEEFRKEAESSRRNAAAASSAAASQDQQQQEQQQQPWQEGSAQSIEWLQTYIQYVRHTFAPQLTPLAQRMLTSYYRYQRGMDSRSAARTTIRLLESLVRLTQAHARLMFRPWATGQDAAMAVLVLDASSQSCSVSGTFGKIGLGSFAADALQSSSLVDIDSLFPDYFQTLLRKLDLWPPSEADELGEEEAFVENCRAVLGEGEELWRVVNSRRSDEAPSVAAGPTMSQSHSRTGTTSTTAAAASSYALHMADPSVHSAVASSSMGTLAASRSSLSVGPAFSGSRMMTAPRPLRPSIAAATNAVQLSQHTREMHLSQYSQDLLYDPFSSAERMDAQTKALEPSVWPGQSQQSQHVSPSGASSAFRGVSPSDGTAAVTSVAVRKSSPAPSFAIQAASAASAPSSFAESSELPAAKRARFGRSLPSSSATAKRTGIAVAASAAAQGDSSDDEDQSIMLLTQKAPSKAAVRTTQRAAASKGQQVKLEPDEDEDMRIRPAANARTPPRPPAQQPQQQQKPTLQKPQAHQLSASLPKPAAAAAPRPPAAPVSKEVALQQLLRAGFTSDTAQTILNNPLRQAAGLAVASPPPPPPVQANAQEPVPHQQHQPLTPPQPAVHQQHSAPIVSPRPSAAPAAAATLVQSPKQAFIARTSVAAQATTPKSPAAAVSRPQPFVQQRPPAAPLQNIQHAAAAPTTAHANLVPQGMPPKLAGGSMSAASSSAMQVATSPHVPQTSVRAPPAMPPASSAAYASAFGAQSALQQPPQQLPQQPHPLVVQAPPLMAQQSAARPGASVAPPPVSQSRSFVLPTRATLPPSSATPFAGGLGFGMLAAQTGSTMSSEVAKAKLKAMLGMSQTSATPRS